MSDERFDHDLRSVLREEAPRDVPDALRRRVAAIPAANPVPAARTRWSWPAGMALRAAAVVAVVALLAVGFWRFGPASQSGVGGSPSPAATAVPSTNPSAGASAGDACMATDLSGRILGWQGAAGSRIADVEITNTAARRCAIRGTPALELVGAAAGEVVLIDSRTAGPSGDPHVAPTDPRLELAPGDRLRTQVAASNYCGVAVPLPSTPIDIAFTLPSGGGRFVATPDTGVSSADAIPPCLGSAGSAISMNGWRRQP